jgi:hypothetical protein
MPEKEKSYNDLKKKAFSDGIEKYQQQRQNISSLFDLDPKTWASRGNPFLWKEMRSVSKNIPFLENEEKMREYFSNLFLHLTGYEITHPEPIRIEKYLQGEGMSDGVIVPSWWLEIGIPTLLERYIQAYIPCNPD